MLGEWRLGLRMLALGLCDQASYASRVSYLTKCRILACQRLEGAPAFCLDTVQASAIRGVRNEDATLNVSSLTRVHPAQS